jgi:uncharacterized protein
VSGHRGDVIDAFVHHTWATQAELREYLPRAWQEFVGRPGSLPDGGGMMALTPENPYRNPLGDKLPASYIAGVPPGSSLEVLKEQLLQPSGASRIVLGYDTGMLLPVHSNHFLARELVRAANNWSVERWLSGQDDRCYGLILVPNQMPDEAAAEIHRLASNPRMVGVLMGANGLNKPFGHPIYHPIYEAAYQHGMPVVLHVGADSAPDTLTEGTAGGPPFTYAEAHMLAAHPIITHTVSLVGQGVFVKMPELKVLVVGTGVTWLLTVIWRYDNEYKALRREVPWLDQQPSYYYQRNIRISTYALDSIKSPATWSTIFASVPRLDEMICYASGYPNWDTNTVAEVAETLPAAVHERVFHANANELFRWSEVSRPKTSQAAANVGVMGAE